MNVLVTGGAGFVGSNFIRHMLSKYDYNIINIDLLTYAGNLENLKDVSSDKRYSFIKGNICDRKLLDEIFTKHDIDTVVNFAAETHVDRSIDNPEIFSLSNILGTQALLDTAKKHWKVEPDNKYSTEFKPGVKFIQISTEEVYGSLGEDEYFTECSTLSPNNPYSASKASAELMARAYHETFGLPVNITRCANNYGPYQFPEKLIPLMINNALNDKPLPVYGDGKQERDWLHVKDHCIAIDTVLHKGIIGQVYNIGGDNEVQNIEIVRTILSALNKGEESIKYVNDRPGHDRRYAVDNSKINKAFGWKPSYTLETGLEETIKWYLENKDWMNHIINGDYLKYYEEMYKEI